jgi:hypothetical protein
MICRTEGDKLVGAMGAVAAAVAAARSIVITPNLSLEHDPEKWKPVFRKDHAQTKR